MKILHISVPKNGGTYIANNLARNFEPSMRYVVDEQTVRLAEFVDAADEITSKYSFVAGHIPFRLASPYAEKFDLVVSSFRDPWARCLSTFKFVTSRQPQWAHLAAADGREAPAKFEQFIETYFRANRYTRNNQCGYLGEANLPDSAMDNIARFDIKMLSCDRLEDDLRGLMDASGLTFHHGATKNASSDNYTIAKGQFPSIDDKIQDWFSGDFQLYDLLSRREVPAAR